MKLRAFRLLVVTFVLSFLAFSLGMNVYAQQGNPGAIWTTRADCGSEQQDVNQYNQGEYIYINGSGFDAGTYNWTITGQPGNASGDPNIVVASGGPLTLGEDGSFCVSQAYLVALDDCGEYTVDFRSTERGGGNKNDNYHVSVNCAQQATPTPGISPSPSPSSSPSPSPSSDPGDPTPTPTSGVTDICANIDGVQTSVPADYHLDASQRNCVQYQYGGPQESGSTGTGGGRVLGASTMAKTGSMQDLVSLVFSAGAISASLGVRYAKKESSN